MKLLIDDAGKRLEVEVTEECSVLDVLQAQRIDIQATCGGVGKCRRCQVLVRDDEGLSYRLACTTPVKDGMEVVVEHAGAMDVVQSGTTGAFPPDEGATGYGMAIDIGTTTVVAHLHDLATGERLATVGRANPQIAFGSDVISRISASIDGKLDLMTGIIQDALREMKAKLCATAKVPQDEVVRATIAGNTVMQHIAVGLPPDTIGVNPFTPLSLFGDEHEIDGLGPLLLRAVHRRLRGRRHHGGHARVRARHGWHAAVPGPGHERRDGACRKRAHQVLRHGGGPGVRRRQRPLRHARVSGRHLEGGLGRRRGCNRGRRRCGAHRHLRYGHRRCGGHDGALGRRRRDGLFARCRRARRAARLARGARRRPQRVLPHARPLALHHAGRRAQPAACQGARVRGHPHHGRCGGHPGVRHRASSRSQAVSGRT